ncbi:hypothetical protein BDQ12DRAFT_87323 [Crucibulum laeve]|uniref:F-box domain-containing protein n=1 Tax=Crucibulum laeve TaxID=68775 RepID=A0A5C3M1D3_9AGAR|nr:hypothetical protein BDQ12DRAFT_87323 [Crucibulum laeve]
MLSIMDVFLSLKHTEGLKWTASWILVLSVVFTYIISLMGTPPPEIVHIERKNYLARSRQWKAAQRAQRELEEKRRLILESNSFPFLSFPPEICMLVLSHCAEWNSTYLSLVRVSRRMRRLASHACLPRMPVVLANTVQVTSFGNLLIASPELEGLVRHLWIEPERGDFMLCKVIVRKCGSLRSLACDARMVEEVVEGHLECRSLTLLGATQKKWSFLLESSRTVAFFKRLTHLRVYQGDIPLSGVEFTNLSHLSYADNRADAKLSVGERILEDKEVYPSLQTVVVTRRRGAGGLRISRPTSRKVFAFEVPDRWTERDMWCASARGRGMWDLCTDERPLSRRFSSGSRS